jgi:hypothetical protein
MPDLASMHYQPTQANCHLTAGPGPANLPGKA